MANLDEALFLAVNGFVGTVAILDEAAALVASDYMVPKALALALIVMWFAERDRTERMRRQIGVITALTAMSLASLIVFIINMFYFRPRPFEDLDANLLFYRPTDSSFPSNAAAAAFGIAFATLGTSRKTGAAFIIAAALYGLARVYRRSPLSAGRRRRSRDSRRRDLDGVQDAGRAHARSNAGDTAGAGVSAGLRGGIFAPNFACATAALARVDLRPWERGRPAGGAALARATTRRRWR